MKESLLTLINSNTLLGGAIPPVANIFQQLEALSQVGYPYDQPDGSGQVQFAGPIWDNLDRYDVTREVFGSPQFHSRTALLMYALGNDPYSWQSIKEYKLCLGTPVFPDNKAVFMPSEYKSYRDQINTASKYVKCTDTSIVVRLAGINKLPVFTVQSVFNPYFQFLRQSADGITVSPDLICAQAKQQNVLLQHKDTKPMVNKITLEGFSPLVGLNILTMTEGVADAQVDVLSSGFPYVAEATTPKAQEKLKADPGNFEL